MASTKLTAYQLLVNCAYSVIPSGGGPSGKAPLIAWEDYQRVTPELADIQAWEQELKPSLWGIVTGAISCIVVIDIDKPELRSMFDEAGLSPHIQTPRGGFHYWFRHPGYPVKTLAGILPGIDIRADGGFVNVIGRRKDGNYKVLIPPSPDSIYPWDKLPTQLAKALNGHKSAPSPIQGIGIPEGERNARLTSLAGSLRRKGLSQEAIEAALQAINSESCKPPLNEAEVANIAQSVAKYPPTTGDNSIFNNSVPFAGAALKRDKNVTDNVTKSQAEAIKDWVLESSGWFSTEECDKDLEIRDSKGKANRRQVFKRLKEDEIIEQHPSSNKLFRHIRTETRLIDFKRSGNRSPIAIQYPFGEEKLFNTFPGSLIVLAGDADAGKTAWILNFIRQNMYDFPIFYQSSEMGADELANRLEKFDGLALEDWNFTAEERATDLADVTRPDCINIFDYMEFEGGKYYEIADKLRAIYQKLKSGIGIVAIQKKRGQSVGRGGDLGLEKPRLYMTMEAGKLTIIKAKNWANPGINPRWMAIRFKIVNGCRLIVTEDWKREEQ